MTTRRHGTKIEADATVTDQWSPEGMASRGGFVLRLDDGRTMEWRCDGHTWEQHAHNGVRRGARVRVSGFTYEDGTIKRVKIID